MQRKVARYGRPRRRWRLWQSLFFLALLVTAFYVFLQSSLFNINSIVVQGNNVLEQDSLRKMSGINPGENIFKVNTGEAARKLAMHPLLKGVEVKRDLPSRIIIAVQERQGLGLVPYQGRFWLIDEEGVLLQAVDSLQEKNLPLLTGIQLKQPHPGLKLNQPGISSGLALLKILPRELYLSTSEIDVRDENNLKLYTVDGIEVRLGDGERGQQKINLFLQVWKEVKDKKLLYVDVSHQGYPTYKTVE
ncbi:MAG: cell division protein FtsQ/DivIB [Bacillota bacterium]|uniref:Cell division protein FtsQ n=2 Tax=Carboxydocella TaxID=178898 RepID=A0A1T4M657_9FIRM|nr:MULTISPECIES: FtsQ-type POTRA domain-containing protein [Carboxydocella]AVX21031.1 cell division protein FtsQ [Carboxydocella thermautotrophica]AVX31451.1 cell division protein FtsQ [Carboxydocella thermautotrophica]SJZ62336.1 cell division protein FtsQ [Carboxydocella sporoproducens DSM 16521]GAW28787.1 polypeptide-transport-associated domain-containing protein FtsQ-type [Carboxydocella sp. ULO1]GAW32645.1 polypeptide-transport-associated domain-containing protein FtsQ-type [Carboxydocella